MHALPKAAAKKRSASEAALPDVRVAEDQSLLEEFKCPLSCKLPVDPVHAADGMMYDMEHIMDWFCRNPGDTCRSPMTNKPIPKTLVPATQIKSTISLLVDRGIIANKETAEWKLAVKEQEGWTEAFKSLVYEAAGGNTVKMALVGDCYRDGVGLPMNKVKALKWFTKASVLGNVSATVAIGVMYTNGIEAGHQGAKQPTRGVLELARAATLGSEHACCILADWLGGTNPGLLRVDAEAATFWYQASLDCSSQDSVATTRKRRDEWFEAETELVCPRESC